METKEKYFERDKDGNMIPITEKIDVRNEAVLMQIKIYEEKLTSENNEKNKSIFQKVIDILKEEYDKSGEEKEYSFIPISLSEYINYQRGFNRNFIKSKDIEEDIITEHLIFPKLENDNSLKYFRVRRKIIEKMYNCSIPDYNQSEEIAKKVIALLEKVESDTK